MWPGKGEGDLIEWWVLHLKEQMISSGKELHIRAIPGKYLRTEEVKNLLPAELSPPLWTDSLLNLRERSLGKREGKQLKYYLDFPLKSQRYCEFIVIALNSIVLM